MLFVLFYVNRATRERKEELKKMYVANFLHSLDSAHVSYSPIISDVKWPIGTHSYQQHQVSDQTSNQPSMQPFAFFAASK